MTFPLVITIELQIDGVWTDVTGDVLQRDRIKIKRGRPNESSKTPPSTCDLTFNNTSGNYSPRNPVGAYYGLLGRNTPVRVKANGGVRFTGEIPAWPQRWDPSGNDVWVPVTASGILRRLGQGQASLQSVLRRGVPGLASLAAYWPCEDEDGATQLASALPGHPPMTLNGELDASSFSDFKATKPIPTASGVTWSGDVPAYTPTLEAQVRFLLAVPADGVTLTSTLCRFTDSTATWTLEVNGSGDLILTGSDTALLFSESSGTLAHDVNGKLLLVSVELTSDGTTDVDWTVATLEVGATAGTVSTGSGSLLSGVYTVGRIQNVTINPPVSVLPDDVAIGQIWVQSEITNINAMADLLAAYAGETAAARISRLCAEQDVALEVVGTAADTVPVGAQLPKDFLVLLREAAEADLGILYEPRDSLGLAYRTRRSLYAQAPVVGFDYSSADLSRIEPVEDDQATNNDVTVTRDDGASVRAELTTGAMSVNAPPDGVGRYDAEIGLNLASDSQLADQASWRLHMGTVDEARYPVIGVNLARRNFTEDPVEALVGPYV